MAPVRSAKYRKAALRRYGSTCVWCGFGLAAVVEVAHLDGNRRNDDLGNLAPLCPTCHRMLDLDFIKADEVVRLRDERRVANWKKLMGDAGARAAKTRQDRKVKNVERARKAAATRRLRQGRANN